MDDEEQTETYRRELEKLEESGTSLAEAVGGLIAPGGNALPNVADDGLAQRGLNEIFNLFPDIHGGDRNVGSTTPSQSETTAQETFQEGPSEVIPCQPVIPQAQQFAPLPPLPRDHGNRRHSVDNAMLAAPSGSLALQAYTKRLESKRLKSSSKRANKVDEHFDISSRKVSGVTRKVGKCIQCGHVVAAGKRRNLLFHLIVCSGLSLEKRLAFHVTSSDAGKPPLLLNPLPGMSPGDAQRLWEEEQKRKTEEGQRQGQNNTSDPTNVYDHGEYLLAKAKLDPLTKISECPSEQQDFATKLLVSWFVDENIPFSACDLRDGLPGGLFKFVNYIRPGYQVPSSAKLSNELLNQYHCKMEENVRVKLRNLLHDGRATVMFDGSEDIKRAPMVNFLIRVLGSAHMNTQTFFLTTFYTGSDTVDAQYYVRLVEEVVNRFIGFDKVAGIVTDNTGSVKNAREILQSRYPLVVSSQDQAHVADRLMTDIGEIKWKSGRPVVAGSTGDIENMSGEKGHEEQPNAVQPAPGEHPRGEEQQGTVDEVAELAELLSDHGDDDNDDDNDIVGVPQAFGVIGSNTVFGASGPFTFEEAGFPPSESAETASTTHPSRSESSEKRESVRKARTMKKVSAVRFASYEKLLDEYISLRPVLLQLIDDPLFDGLYKTKNEGERMKRTLSFVEPIRSEETLLRVRQTHEILDACTSYLRIFDSERAMVSEVMEVTEVLEKILKKLPGGFYPEPKEANRKQLLKVFENRMSGPLPGHKQIQVRLLSDLHVTAALLDPYRTPLSADDYMDSFRCHLDRYIIGMDWEKLGITEEDSVQFIEQMISQYIKVRGIWRQRGFLKERTYSSTGSGSPKRTREQGGKHSETDGTVKMSGRSRRTGNPISWWTSGSIQKPRDAFERKAVEELIEFARCTLSVSPTASATERTFSLENRIHTKMRSTLGREKVRKILFCQWNGRVLRRFASRDEGDLGWEIEKHFKRVKKLRHVESAAEAAAEAEASQSISVHQQSPEELQPADGIDNSRRRKQHVNVSGERLAFVHGAREGNAPGTGLNQRQTSQVNQRHTSPVPQIIPGAPSAEQNIPSSNQPALVPTMPLILTPTPQFPMGYDASSAFAFFQTMTYPAHQAQAQHARGKQTHLYQSQAPHAQLTQANYATRAGNLFGAVIQGTSNAPRQLAQTEAQREEVLQRNTAIPIVEAESQQPQGVNQGGPSRQRGNEEEADRETKRRRR